MRKFWKRAGLLLVDGPADRYIKALSLLDQAETLVPEAALAIGEAKSAVMEQLEVADPEGVIKVREEIRPPVVVICGTCQGKKTIPCPAGCGEEAKSSDAKVIAGGWSSCACCHGRGEITCPDCNGNNA